MKKEIAMMWVKALRSGTFKQIEGSLENTQGGNCCLGVLCNLALLEGVCDYRPADPDNLLSVQFDNSDEFLPRSVQEWAGMKTNAGELKVTDSYGVLGRTNLAELNDGERGKKRTFKEIANIIEANWKDL